MTTSRMIRIGTRGSALARWQANWVAEQLTANGVQVELVHISTRGDVQQQGPIGAIGTQGVFTKEIQNALLDERVDLAVHSLKDLPTDPVPGLQLSAVPPRASYRDALLTVEGALLAELPQGARVGTGSLRRRAQLLRMRPDLKLLDVRGNVDTRLEKLRAGEYDALVLAEAGLMRLGLSQHITELLPTELVLPAVGQGALGLETRSDDSATIAALQSISHAESFAAVQAERSLLAALRGGCLAPVAALGEHVAGKLQLTARVLSHDGQQALTVTHSAASEEALALGERVAEELLSQGAAQLIQQARDAQ